MGRQLSQKESKGMIIVRDLTIGQLIDFLKIARPEDLAEVQAMTGHSILEEPLALLEGAKAIIFMDCPEGEEVLLGIGAVAIECRRGIEGMAIPWLLLTTEVYKHPIEFLRFSKRYLQELLKTVSIVGNAVYAKNELHIKWLTWLGCEWVGEHKGGKIFAFQRGD
jgi:hypothetical protein